jgi:hypothetical protein
MGYNSVRRSSERTKFLYSQYEKFLSFSLLVNIRKQTVKSGGMNSSVGRLINDNNNS